MWGIVQQHDDARHAVDEGIIRDIVCETSSVAGRHRRQLPVAVALDGVECLDVLPRLELDELNNENNELDEEDAPYHECDVSHPRSCSESRYTHKASKRRPGGQRVRCTG